MKAKDIAQKTDKEINQMIEELSKKLAKTRVSLRTQKVTNPREIRYIRRDIARGETILRERTLGSEANNG